MEALFAIFSLSMAVTDSMVSSDRKCIHTSKLLLLTTLLSAVVVSCYNTDIPNYHGHCALVVPESTPTAPEFTTIPFARDQDGYYLGGDGIFNLSNSSSYYFPTDRKILLFRTNQVHRTSADDVYKVEASLILQPSRRSYIVEDVRYSYSHFPQVISSWSDQGSLSFKMEGYWSKSTGKLCMVGSSSTYLQEGKARVLNALLKLYGVKSVNNITSLIRGTLESLNSAGDSSYFEHISVLMFPRMNYEYTATSKDLNSVCTGGIDTAKSSLRLPLSKSVCSVFSRWSNLFQLLYSKDCDSIRNCNPLVEDLGFLPRTMSMILLECANDKPSLRFLVEFPNNSYSHLPFSPNITFVAEGSWNAEKNQLCAVGCRISTVTDSLDSSIVKDCSIRMSLSFPSVWSIRSKRGIVGHIWSNQTKTSGYFQRIMFQSYGDEVLGIPGLKYNYTLIDTARKSCPEKQPRSTKKSRYPDACSYDMRFDMAVANSSGKRIGWGYATPLSVGDQITKWGMCSPASSSHESIHPIRPLNISYKITIPAFNASLNQYAVEIPAEGIYDPQTGDMCLVGCRFLSSNDQISTDDLIDCNIHLSIQFPPVDSNSYIRGNIKSAREKSDPLFMEPLSFSAASINSRRARQSIWRMDMEIIMALVSNTLLCLFVGYQILFVKKHPNVFPYISLLMLVVLMLGHMIPLVLNFEALFFSKENPQFLIRSAGGWFEINEVMVRVVTMVAFLLQVRLLQLVLSARLADENQKAAWIAERRTLYVSLPLYIVWGLVALSVNWNDYKFSDSGRMNYSYSNRQQHSLWVDLRSYAGLILDGFLLPQILLNIFHNSRENVLSCFFYTGTTFVRVLPHAYDLYRTHVYAEDFDWSYMYADPAADYYSTTWDVIVPLGGLLFAAIIYLQQRNGGRFFLPIRFLELPEYEKLPVPREP